MKKSLLVLFFLLSIRLSAQNTSFTIQQEITGLAKVTVNAFGFTSMEIKCWESALDESTATFYNSGTYNTYWVKLNPFKNWSFRVKVNFGAVGDWSQIETLDNSCTQLPNYVGLTESFSANPVLSCWRGYFVDSYSGSADYILYTTSGFIQIASQTGSKVLVSPKLEDLSTDKKVKFRFRSNTTFSGYSIKVGTIENPYDLSTFHQLGSFNVSSVNQFETKTLYLNNYNGVDKYIAFLATGGNTTVYSLDDFSYEQSVNCYDATAITFNNITTNSATMDFNSSGQTTWELKLKNTITNVTQTIPVSSGNVNFTGLNPGTTYEVTLRANCDVGLYSNWSPVNTFTTACQEVSVGYYTGFDQFSYLDPCWKRIMTGSDEIMVYNNATSASAPNHVSFQGTNTSTTILVSPYVTDFVNKRVRFKLYDNKRANFLKFSFTVGVLSNPTDATTFIPIKTFTNEEINPIGLFDLGSFWQQYIVDFNAVSANNHYIGFKIGNASVNFSEQSILLDDIYFEEIPQCKEPTNIQIINFDYDKATISWDSDVSVPSWEIEYGPTGFVAGTGTITSANTTPFTLTGLSSDTGYDFYLRGVCSNGSSLWSIKRSFKTRCEGVYVGYTSGFETETFDPYATCWQRTTPLLRSYSYSPNYFINRYNNGQLGSQTAHTGTKFIVMKGGADSPDTNEQDKTILVSPRLIDLDNSKQVSFWVFCPSNGYSTLQKIVVGTLSNPDDYNTFTEHEVISGPFTSNQWRQYTIDLSSFYGTDKFVGIKQISSSGNYFLYIDDFEYTENPCRRPTNLMAVQSGQNSATLSWNSNIPVDGSTTWQIEYGEMGFTPGTGTVITLSNSPYVLNNLILNKKYQFRVRNNCANGVINWSNLYSFKISCTVSVPFYENFDQFQPVANFIFLPANLCWSSQNSMSAALYSYSLNNVNSPPNVGFVESNSAGEGVFVSPYLSDFDNTKRIKFWTKLQVLTSTQNLSIIVGTVKNPLDLSTFEPFQVFPLSGSYQSGQEFTVDFSTYTGDSKHIAFKTSGYFSDGGYTTNRIFFDDIYYTTIPDCSEPIDVTFSQTNHNSTLLQWENTGTVQSTRIEYGLSGFTPGTGTVLNSNANQLLITGLNPTSNYEFYLNAVCEGNNNSAQVGPYDLITTCIPNTVPWTETFNSLGQYGQNMLPPCFKLPGNNSIFTRNVPITLNSDLFSPDNTLNGFDDSFYLHATTNTFLFTPMFHLEQGTSYKFSLQARKRYEYDFSNIKMAAYRGQETYAHVADLNITSFLSEFDYNEGVYFYTPIETGDYSFLLFYNNSGSLEIVSDVFALDEGYPGLVSTNRLFDFSQGLGEDLITEKTENTNVALENLNNNMVLKFTGSNDALTFTTNGNVWSNNQNSISKVNFKINNDNFSTLFLSFKLKQTYNEQSSHSAFRLIVNGNDVAGVIYPSSANQDEYQTYEYDLTSFLGDDLKISLQHLGKSTTDNAFLDDLSVNQNSLSSPDFNPLNGLKVYPNPTNTILNIKSDYLFSSVKVYSISGQQLQELSGEFYNQTLDMSNYSAGFYFIKVISEYGSKIFKIFKRD